VVIVLGGATGRDGVGGATGSSKEQDETSIHTMSSEVQKGNAVEERKIQRLFRNPEVTKLIKKSNDLERVEFLLRLAKLLIHWKLTSMFYL
jgi:phosphoribosylformylglycinamidine synthase